MRKSTVDCHNEFRLDASGASVKTKTGIFFSLTNLPLSLKLCERRATVMSFVPYVSGAIAFHPESFTNIYIGYLYSHKAYDRL